MSLKKVEYARSPGRSESSEFVSSLIADISGYLLSEDLQLAAGLSVKIDKALTFYVEACCSMSDLLVDINEELKSKMCDQNRLDNDSWRDEAVLPSTRTIPHMLYENSYGYYKWLGKNCSGVGSIVELGCWMGATTSCLAEGLKERRGVSQGKIHVFDSFIWKKPFLSFGNLLSEQLLRLKEGDCFLPIFSEYTGRFRDFIEAQQCCVNVGSPIDNCLPEFQWNGDPIEIMVMDLCPDQLENRLVWDCLQPYFIPKKTILVYNQFGNIEAVELRKFLREKAKFLLPVHKPYGSIKAFRYVN